MMIASETMHVERRSLAPASRAPLPEPVRSALAAISGDLRDLPRDCVRDPAELLFWLRRMARRVEGVAEMKVAAVLRDGRKTTLPQREIPPRARCGNSHIGRPPSAREIAEAVFGQTPPTVRKRVETRTVTSRRGRAVKVETRRARAAGQLEMWT